MYLDLPIEQLVRRKGAAFQFAFATEPKELLPQRDEFLLKASHKGLHVLARNEDAWPFRWKRCAKSMGQACTWSRREYG